MAYFYSPIDALPDDPIFGLQVTFNQDLRKDKINLSIGAYQNESGTWEVLKAVREAEKNLLAENLNKEYLPIEGHPAYIDETLKLIFGKNSDHIFGAQTIGGTSALRLGGDFISQNITKNILISNPTWTNHHRIFSHAGLQISEYPYYVNHSLDFEGMCATIKAATPGTAILLHACCHNPSGIDPTEEQWMELSKIIKEKSLFPFFDMAYQGFGAGIEEDAFAVRHFLEEGHEMLVAYSYSKNLGLYGERVGLLAAVAQNRDDAERIGSVIKGTIRGSYSNPTLQGARIVATILKNKELRSLWLQELDAMRKRTVIMRQKLYEGLKFDFLLKQKGMFSYSGLKPDEVVRLQNNHGIYMLKNGRINVTGLNEHNINTVITAIKNL